MVYTQQVIGRKSDSDIVLANQRVSGKHATVRFGGLNPSTITKHSERNGLWVRPFLLCSARTFDYMLDTVMLHEPSFFFNLSFFFTSYMYADVSVF